MRWVFMLVKNNCRNKEQSLHGEFLSGRSHPGWEGGIWAAVGSIHSLQCKGFCWHQILGGASPSFAQFLPHCSCVSSGAGITTCLQGQISWPPRTCLCHFGTIGSALVPAEGFALPVTAQSSPKGLAVAVELKADEQPWTQQSQVILGLDLMLEINVSVQPPASTPCCPYPCLKLEGLFHWHSPSPSGLLVTHISLLCRAWMAQRAAPALVSQYIWGGGEVRAPLCTLEQLSGMGESYPISSIRPPTFWSFFCCLTSQISFFSTFSLG